MQDYKSLNAMICTLLPWLTQTESFDRLYIQLLISATKWVNMCTQRIW